MDGSDVLCSYGGFSGVTPLLNPATGEAWSVQELFSELLAEGRIAAPGKKVVTDSAATPLWPQQQAVQPLMANMTDKVEIRTGSLTYDAASGLYSGTITVHNPGGSTLAAPLRLVLADLDAAVRLTNAQGVWYGQPFVRLPVLPPGGTDSVAVQFSNPERKPVSYQPQVWNGGV